VLDEPTDGRERCTTRGRHGPDETGDAVSSTRWSCREIDGGHAGDDIGAFENALGQIEQCGARIACALAKHRHLIVNPLPVVARGDPGDVVAIVRPSGAAARRSPNVT